MPAAEVKVPAAWRKPSGRGIGRARNLRWVAAIQIEKNRNHLSQLQVNSEAGQEAMGQTPTAFATLEIRTSVFIWPISPTHFFRSQHLPFFWWTGTPPLYFWDLSVKTCWIPSLCLRCGYRKTRYLSLSPEFTDLNDTNMELSAAMLLPLLPGESHL